MIYTAFGCRLKTTDMRITTVAQGAGSKLDKLNFCQQKHLSCHKRTSPMNVFIYRQSYFWQLQTEEIGLVGNLSFPDVCSSF